MERSPARPLDVGSAEQTGVAVAPPPPESAETSPITRSNAEKDHSYQYTIIDEKVEGPKDSSQSQTPKENSEPEERPKGNQSSNEEAEHEEDNEDEESECGFCLFMKGGGCKDAFIAWEKCVEEADTTKEDVVEKCFEVTSLLKKCMDAHSDYYEPILRAEKAMEEEAVKELDKEYASSSQAGVPSRQE